MSKYLLDKFLYTVDRDPDLVERYRSDPAGTVEWWEREIANSILNCHGAERSTWLAFSEEERRALRSHDHVALFGMGAHPHAPGNATHGFMDFMLMMGAAGDGVKADYTDSLDLFHTMEAYFTWYPEGAPS